MALHDQGQRLGHAPGQEGPARAVPEADVAEDDDIVQPDYSAVTAEGNVDRVPQPGADGDVPAAPDAPPPGRASRVASVADGGGTGQPVEVVVHANADPGRQAGGQFVIGP